MSGLDMLPHDPASVPPAAAADSTESRLGSDSSSTVALPTHSDQSAVPFPAVPGYEIVALIGAGGMGVVYQARDLRLHRDVAIKMVLGGAVAGRTAIARFLAEAEALAALQHPHVVQVFDRGECQGLPFFVMEFCPGGSLADRVRQNPLAGRDAAAVMEKLALGVAAAHARNILHRDLKPENVLYTADSAPKLTDFGLAKRLDDAGQETTALTQTGVQLGTPSYMAPEQAKGDTKWTGPRADIYSLGAILYRLVTGRPPFVGANSVETMRQVVEDEPVSPTVLAPGLPRDLTTICLKCLAKDPVRRYESAADLAEDLRRFLDGQPILARPVGSGERMVKWVRRNQTLAAALGAVAAVLVVGSIATGVSAVRAADSARRESAARADLEDQKRSALAYTRFMLDHLGATKGQRAELLQAFLKAHPELREEDVRRAFEPPIRSDTLVRAPEAGTHAAPANNPNMFGD
jgi:eukaryotic-like serine/threonine-protein kinase